MMKRQPRILRSLLVAGTALTVGWLGQAQKIYQEVDGRVVVEAENVSERTAGPNHQWLIVPDEEANPVPASSDARPASNPRYLQVLPNGAGGYTDPLADPHADFKVLINTAPGTYQLWLRWRGHSGNEDSLFTSVAELSDGVGGTVPDWYRFNRGGGSSFINSWQGTAGWERTDASGNDEPVIFDIPTPGIYTIRLTFREDGAAVDTIMLQLSSLEAPGEPGPDESPVTGTYPPALTRTMPQANSTGVSPLSDLEVDVEDGSDATIVDASVKLFLEGEELASATVSRSGPTVTAAADLPGMLEAGKVYSARVTYEDSDGTPYDRPWQFTVYDYPTIPASWALGGSPGDPNMNIDVYQTDAVADGIPAPALNSLATTEQWWARGFPVGGPSPWENQMQEWWPQFTGGIATVNWVGNLDEFPPGDVDATPADGPDNFNSARPTANPQANDPLPGIPGYSLSYEYYVVEVSTYLQLSAGLHRMGVNSDDGFRVSVAPGQPEVFGLTLGLFDAGRGAADTLFYFNVEQAGLYAFRLLYWQGTGGGSCEWFTEDLTTGERTLVNGTGSPVQAYRSSTGNRAHVTSLLPANGFQAAEPSGPVTIQIEDDTTQVEDGSVQLLIDDVEVTPNVSKSGTRTSVTWTPPAALDFNSDHTGRLIWTETTTPEMVRTDDFSFRVRGLDATKDPATLLSGPPTEMRADRVILVWTISIYATQLNPTSLEILVNDADLTGQAVVSEDATQSFVTLDLSGTRFELGDYTWSFHWADTGTKSETVTGSFKAVSEKPPINANIAWVSFHPADDQPSSAAATAGFTEAPDAPYTQLLRDNGHTVTRVVTSATPDVDYLNTFDLVIISRSVPSGNYQNPPSPADWNGIEAPTIILGGYILRSSRLGYTTGDTMVDTTGTVKLKVNAPGHPVFDGVSLDGTGLMVNDYANIVSFNAVVQRGVSVNTDPVATGGVTLATIGTEGDPAFGGMVIGEWQAGSSMADGSADILGGHRLVLLTGSRENDGLTSEGAGIYDLMADGARLLLNCYLLRNNRLGFTTGGTMVDTTGPITLNVPAPAHPLFDGVLLDGQNNLLGTYADLATFIDTVQRGISVNTDPLVAGGTVLATVATEADPTVGGTIIAEFPAGTVVGAGRDVLAGDRLLLLTGSREHDGLTSHGAGIYDLTPEGEQLLLNAVNYLAKPPPPTLGISLDAGNVVISWEGDGTLQEAAVVTGPFTDVAGAASPFSAPADAPEKYYRLMQ